MKRLDFGSIFTDHGTESRLPTCVRVTTLTPTENPSTRTPVCHHYRGPSAVPHGLTYHSYNDPCLFLCQDHRVITCVSKSAKTSRAAILSGYSILITYFMHISLFSFSPLPSYVTTRFGHHPFQTDSTGNVFLLHSSRSHGTTSTQKCRSTRCAVTTLLYY